MFPSPSHLSSASNMHHQPRQSKQLDTQAYSQLQSQAPPPNRIRTQQTTIKRSLIGGHAPNRTAHRQADSNSSGINTPSCANCATQTTPLWRRNQSGQTLCNACALFQKMKGRPRPMSLKTNVIKPRNRIKAIDRIPLGPSQQSLLTARSNNSLVNFNHQQSPHALVHADKNNQNYPPHPRNVKSPVSGTPTSSLFPHSFRSNPIAPHLCSPSLSSPNQIRTPTSKPHFLDPHRLSPSPINLVTTSSQSPSSSQNSFFSTRSAPQVQSDPTQLVRSGISSRKSSPGGVEPSSNPDVHTATSFEHEAKRRKYLSDDLLNKTNLYERRISTGSIEPLHQRHHHLPPRASSHARIHPATSAYPDPSDHRAGPSSDHHDQLLGDAPPSNLDYCGSAEDNSQNHSQFVSTLSSGQKTPASIDRDQNEHRHSMSATLNCQSRGRSTLRPSRFTLPPLSQITQDLPAFRQKANPINLGPPLSFEASAREARLNSPNSSQHLLTIPTSTHQKRFEKRRAVSVISSVSDSESVLSPAHTASSGSRIHSPLDRSHFQCNSGSPITPPVNGEVLMCKPHDDSKTYFNQYQSGRDKSSYDSGSQSETEKQNLDVPQLHTNSTYHSSEENELQAEELNRLKNRIVQLELINGVMETRINELENTHTELASKGSLSEISDERSSSCQRLEARRNSFRTVEDEHHSPSNHSWVEGNCVEDEQVERMVDEEDQEDQIDDMDHDDHMRAEA